MIYSGKLSRICNTWYGAYILLHRDDFKEVYANLRHVIAQIKPEWEDAQVYEKLLDDIGEEVKNNKISLQLYSYVARKPKNV